MLYTRKFVAAAIVVLTLTATGCLPGVSWLPDSSGFVFTTGKNSQRLVRYDLANHEQRVLVDDMDAATPWPAVSPDGTRIAVARMIREKGRPESMQVILYDMNGKELHRSIEYGWREASDGRRTGIQPTGLFWNPTGKQFVVYDYEEDKATTGIYDPEQNRMLLMPGRPCICGTLSARPDGKGFLIVDGTDNAIHAVAFVDWEGNRQPIEMKPDTIDDKDKRSMLIMPFLCTSFWEGNRAVFTWEASCIEIDTDKRTGTFSKVPAANVKVGDKLIHQNFAFTNGGAKVRVLSWLDETDREQHHYSLEIIKPTEEKARTLVKRSSVCYLSPSPDGKFLAIRCLTEDQDHKIIVVDRRGEIISEIGLKED